MVTCKMAVSASGRIRTYELRALLGYNISLRLYHYRNAKTHGAVLEKSLLKGRGFGKIDYAVSIVRGISNPSLR